MQNDDWNRTSSVMRFLSGNLTLNPKTATTFYSQGFIGTAFSSVFGWENLPFLTLIFSILNFYLLAKILTKHFNLKKLTAILISLVMFFSPLHIYSAIGFMTENYTLFFILLSTYFFLSYEKRPNRKDFILFDLSGLLAFFSKQNGIMVQAASIPYFLIKKRYKAALIQVGFLSATFSYYYLLFPRTPEMMSKDFAFENITKIHYSYSLVYEMLLVMSSYLLPVLIWFVISTYLDFKKNFKVIVLLIITSIACYFFMNRYFEPGKISWREYQYFENTFERTGFLPRSLMGTKYQFRGNFKLYKYWDLSSKVFLALTIPCLFIYRKKQINMFSIAICGYMLLMIFVAVFFDRYLLPLFPFMLLYFCCIKPPGLNHTKLLYATCIPFILFICFFSMQLGNDFVLSNNYVWSRSKKLVKNNQVSPQNIRAGSAWGKLYGVTTRDFTSYQYLFSFDSPDINPEIMRIYKLVEIENISFPGNIFINPKVYLYTKK